MAALAVELPAAQPLRAARRAPALPSVGLGRQRERGRCRRSPAHPRSPRCSRCLARLGAVGATGHRAPRPALPSRHPPPPSPSACFPLLLVRCPAWCVLPAAAAAPRRRGAAWLCLRPSARCLPVCVRAGPASPCRSPAAPNTPLSAPRRQGEDVEAALVHPDRQLPVLLRVHHGQWPSRGVLSWGREGAAPAAPGGRGQAALGARAWGCWQLPALPPGAHGGVGGVWPATEASSWPPQDKEPRGIIPLENLSIREVEDSKKPVSARGGSPGAGRSTLVLWGDRSRQGEAGGPHGVALPIPMRGSIWGWWQGTPGGVRVSLSCCRGVPGSTHSPAALPRPSCLGVPGGPRCPGGCP